MTINDYDMIRSYAKAIEEHIETMTVTRYEWTYEEAYKDAMNDLKSIAEIIYNARYKLYHKYKEEEDE